MSATIICGNALDELRKLPDASVQCCVSSPPYWGLRDYGHADQIGLEATPEEYVSKIVAVFREVRRVLRADGTLWLNLGDCYATGAGKVGDHPGGGAQGQKWRGGHEGKHGTVGPRTQPNRLPLPGLKPKDLVGIPWAVAFALRADGWWLRAENIWAKPSPMPESVTDRTTRSHEQVFMLSKSRRYFYDADAIAEQAVGGHRGSLFPTARRLATKPDVGTKPRTEKETRNARSVWTIAATPFDGAHFAVMPEELARRCILAGSGPVATVLDPFAGAATVGVVALKHGRSFIGIELNESYAQMARERIRADAPLLNQGVV